MIDKKKSLINLLEERIRQEVKFQCQGCQTRGSDHYCHSLQRIVDDRYLAKKVISEIDHQLENYVQHTLDHIDLSSEFFDEFISISCIKDMQAEFSKEQCKGCQFCFFEHNYCQSIQRVYDFIKIAQECQHLLRYDLKNFESLARKRFDYILQLHTIECYNLSHSEIDDFTQRMALDNIREHINSYEYAQINDYLFPK